MIEKKERQSGFELLKIVAMLLIVINHVTQSLEYLGTTDSLLFLGHATMDIQILTLNLLRQFGGIGNDIFFICSAWFLIGKKEKRLRKHFTFCVPVG